MVGFIQLQRKLLEWEWYQDTNVFRVFIHLLLKANFKDTKWKGITIKRGHLIIGTEKLGREVGLSRQEVKTVLKKLKKTKELTTKATTKYLIVTLVNFDLYQGEYNYEQPSKQPSSNHQATIKQPQRNNENKEISINNNKLVKNYEHPIVSNNIKIILSLNEFWTYELKQTFTSFCHHRNGLGKSSFSWGRGSQIEEFARKVNDSIIKNGEKQTIKFIKDAEFGGFYEPKYEPLKNNKQPAKEQTILEYYEKYINPNNLPRFLNDNKLIIDSYPKYKDIALERKISLNCKNEHLTTPFIFDVMYGKFKSAGAKPESRFNVFRTFLSKQTDFIKNKGDLRSEFIKYLGKR